MGSMKGTRWFLGVDGGGTKTGVAVLDSQGKLRALVKGPPSLVTQGGLHATVAAVRAAVGVVERRLRLIRPRYVAACFALAGVDSDADVRRFRSAFRRAFGTRIGRLEVCNDTYAALRAGTSAHHAAVVVAGTGSNAVAVGPKGMASAGGNGWIMGDDGGGFWIGRRGLRAALRHLDGRGPATGITPTILHAVGARDIATLHDRITEALLPKRFVSLLSIAIDRAARRGDRTARSILNEAGERLATMAQAATRRSGLGRQPFPLVLSGGTFRSPRVLASFLRGVKRTIPNAKPIRLRIAPAIGAAWLAVDAVGGVR
jgi:N-acetylglucosamine kinase-like BadF-type ATPase